MPSPSSPTALNCMQTPSVTEFEFAVGSVATLSALGVPGGLWNPRGYIAGENTFVALTTGHALYLTGRSKPLTMHRNLPN